MFKIGDKVKPKDPKWRHGAGIVVEVQAIWVRVKYDTSACVMCNDPSCFYQINKRYIKRNDLESMVVKNQQLEFNFMR